jgi:hypothetical protein
MLVEIVWESDTLAVPLIQLEASEADEETQQAILFETQSRTLIGITGLIEAMSSGKR